MEHVRAQVAMGPRRVGSSGHLECRRYIREQLTALGLSPVEQPLHGGMANIIARIPGNSRRVVVLGAHYDTKCLPDIDFVGANDGASGVAVVLEVARAFCASPGPVVEVVFFDGEEGTGDDLYGLHGSTHYVQQANRSEIKAAIVVDMVGDRNLCLNPDVNSTESLFSLVWGQAERMGYIESFSGPPMDVTDDHTPFIRAGLQALCLIHLPEYWHTAEDSLDKISAESLEMVARVVEASIRKL